MHELVTNDFFILCTGIASLLSFFISLFVVQKVKNIDKSLNQKQSGINNKQAGRDIN
jgi:hypothetical protein